MQAQLIPTSADTDWRNRELLSAMANAVIQAKQHVHLLRAKRLALLRLQGGLKCTHPLFTGHRGRCAMVDDGLPCQVIRDADQGTADLTRCKKGPLLGEFIDVKYCALRPTHSRGGNRNAGVRPP